MFVAVKKSDFVILLSRFYWVILETNQNLISGNKL